MNNKPFIRRGQIITTFGPGALVNLENGSYIGMGLDTWPTNNVLYEERLQKRLRTQFFVEPPSEENYPKGLPYRRFPRWLFCPQCRILKSYEKWKLEDKRKYTGAPLLCSFCKYRPLVPMSFIVACVKGHVDDFPWIWWVHRGIDTPCSGSLKYLKSAGGSGLGSSLIKCTDCGKSRPLQGSFSKDAFKDYRCKGSQPWITGGKEKDCSASLKTVQRGGSNVYFPKIVSSITIPPYSDPLLEKIHRTDGWKVISTAKMTGGDPVLIDKLMEVIAKEVREPKEKIQKIVSSIDGAVAEIDSEEAYRFGEYEAFQGRYDRETSSSKDFDVIDGTQGLDYSKFGISKVFLVKALREVRALVGFTRVDPFEMSPENPGEIDKKDESPELVKLGSTWLPAVEVRGEGIFITFNQKSIDEWINKELVLKREAIINSNYSRSKKRGMVYSKISAKKILLHTISHLLIRQLSFECGYSSASLREKIYCDESGDKNRMEGILIYTAAGDSDGTLGGLVRQGKFDRFPGIIEGMLSNSLWCSNDPLCIESKGQGYDSLDLSACYACALLPETSCEEFNRFLDRAMIAGLPDDSSVSFFEKIIKNAF